MYSSFYGGRDGRPFNIKKTYPDIETMLNDFGNPDFKEVAFGEFVYIECINKRHPDHGKLFRRDADINSSRTIQYGLDQNEIKANGATYICCIAGPDGDVPTIQFVDDNTFDELSQKIHLEANKHLNGVEHSGQWTMGNGLVLDNKASSVDYRVINYRDEQGVPRGIINLTMPIPNVEIEANNPAGAKEQDKFVFEKKNGEGPFHHSFQLNIPEHLVKKQFKVIPMRDVSYDQDKKPIMEDIADGGVIFITREK